jgi:hypothetical protein
VRIERGRKLSSSGDAGASMPLFEAAFERASAAGEHYLAADAAHMAAAAAPTREGPGGVDGARSHARRARAGGSLLGRQLRQDLGATRAGLFTVEPRANALLASVEVLEVPQGPQTIRHAAPVISTQW